MKCPDCGFDIPEGKLFCPRCGKEIRIVPDYNVFEEDTLSSIISEEEKEKREQKKEIELKKQKAQNKRINKRLIVFVLFAILIAIICSFVIYNSFHSYSYYMDRGAEYENDKDYPEAYNWYMKAVDKNPTAKAYTKAGEMLYNSKDYKEAEKMLYKALDITADYKNAYKILIRIYLDNEDFDSLYELKDSAESSKIKALFSDVVTDKVTFSDDSGKYTDDLELKLKSSESNEIYYTIDGTEPSQDNGLVYKEPIILQEGKTTVKAVCVNINGVFGEVTEKEYEISYEKPENPVVSPESGNFQKSEKITISADGGCRIFYSWDGDDPTADSTEYTGPIDMPEGNNVISVIAIDEHELTSDVVRKNYIFQP